MIHSITEGESFKFLVEADIVPLTAISVELEINDNSSGHYKSTTPTAPIAMHNVRSVEVTLATNNTTTEAHSAIDVSIDTTNVTTYTTATSNTSITVGIEDSVKPEVSIASTQHDGILTEGGSFTFTLTADPVPYSAITVDITAVDSGTSHLTSLTGSDSSAISVAADGSAQVEIGTSGTAQVTVATTNDTVNVRHGVIDISIDSVTNAAYTVVADPVDETDTTLNAIQVKVKDTVKPVVSISTNSNKVSEGSSFTFSLSASPVPIAPISVDITAVELVVTGHLSKLTGPNSSAISVASDGSAEVEIGTSGSVDVIVATTNDTTHKRHGEIKVSLDDGTFIDYAVTTSTSQRVVQTKVEDLIAPDISISSTKDDSHITEGESFKFLVEADIVPLTAISIELDIDDNSNHYKSIIPTAPIAMLNVSSVEVSMSTNNTNSVEHGEIEITIDAPDTNKYSASRTNDSITVGIKDSVKPVISISSIKNNGLVTEGGSFTFTLTAVPAPFSPTLIDITVVDAGTGHLGTLTNSDSSTILVEADSSAQVEIGTSGIAKVTVTTINDATNVRHGEIDISLDDVTDADYEVATDPESDEDEISLSAIQVKIKDKTAPVISISAVKNVQSITEGGIFVFRIAANLIPLTPISVKLDINDEDLGHYPLTAPRGPIPMHNVQSVDFSLITINTPTVEHGEIEISIDDANTTAYSASTMHDSVTVGIKDSAKPVVSISSSKNNDRVKEGTEFTFRLTAEPAPYSPIMVGILAEETVVGHLGTSFTGPNSSTIAVASDGSAQVELGSDGFTDITVNVLNDSTNQRHGEIDVSLKEVNNASYEVIADSTKKTIAVKIEDAKPPIISITSTRDGGHITEGKSFTFKLKANIVPLTAISVDLEIDDERGHFKEITPGKPIEMDNITETTVDLATNDTSTPVHGEIEVSIKVTDTSYTPSSLDDSITVGIKDTIKPKVSISIEPEEKLLDEGNSFTFSLSAVPAPFEPITVDITATDVNDTGHLGALMDSDENVISVDSEDGSAQVEIGTGGLSQFTLTTNNDSVNKRHGEIKISLNSVTNEADYRVTTTTSQQEVKVKVEDLVAPVISITSTKDGKSITEGDNFIFRLVADVTPLTPISVKLNLSEDDLGDYFQIVNQENIPISMHDVDSVDVTFNSVPTTGINHNQITISINDINATTYSASGDLGSIIVKIRDSVIPVVSIESDDNSGVISEGDGFTFTLTANPAPIEPILVDLTANDQDTGHLDEITYADSTTIIRDTDDGSIQVEIGISGFVVVSVSSNNDTINKRNGQIGISFKELSEENKVNYAISEDDTKQEIVVKIEDKIAPVVSVTSANTALSVTEGEQFVFRVESDLEILTPIFVKLDISSDSGHFNQTTPTAPIELINVDLKEVTLTTNNTTEVGHGEVSILINTTNVSTYTKSASDSSLIVRIRDSVIPVVSIASVKDEGVITEGEKFEFLISADPAPIEPISVEFTAVDVHLTGHLGTLSSTSPVEIGTDGTATIIVSTNLDDQLFRHGEIRVTLDEVVNADYKLATDEGSKLIKVHVRDIVDPVVSITSESDGRSITEGGEFDFSLSVSPAPVVPIFVVLDIDDENSGYFRALTVSNPVELDGKSPVEVTLFTKAVRILDNPGSISVQIGNAENGEYTVSRLDRAISVTVDKEIVHRVSITPHNQNLTAVEGESIRFSLTVSPALKEPIRVSLRAIDKRRTGHFVSFLGPDQILIRTDGYAEGAISTRNISDKISPGIIEIEILSGDDYEPSRESGRIEIVVLDKIEPELREVFVEAEQPTSNNPDHVIFNFRAIPASVDDIKVEILVNQVGGAIRWRAPTTILVRDRKRVAIPINKVIDPTTNPEVSVMVVNHPHYIAGSETVKVTIQSDNVNQNQGDEARIAIASQVADLVLKIQNDNLIVPETTSSDINSSVRPVVAVMAIVDTIQEGELAQFQISSSLPISTPISIHVEQSGEFLSSTPPTQYLLNGEKEGILELATSDDQIAEPDGTITLSITYGRGYIITEGNASASVSISDHVDRVARQQQIISNISHLLPQINQAESELLNESLTNRIQSFNSAERKSYFNLGGQHNMQDLIISTGETINDNDVLVRRLLDKSSFEFNIIPDSGFINTISAWGQSNFRSLNTISNGAGDLGSGELFNGQFGFDSELIPELITGLGTSITRSTVNLDSSSLGDIEFQTNSTQFNPYIGWTSADNSSELRSMFGIGFGEINANQAGYESSTFESELYSFALDGRFALLQGIENTEIDLTGQTNLKNIVVKGNEEFDEYVELTSRYSRVALESFHEFELLNGITLTPNASVGLIESESTDQSAFLTEYIGGISYTSLLGLEIDGEGRIYSNQPGQIDEWKLSGSLSYDWNQDKLGFAMKVSTEYCSNCTTDSANLFGSSSSLISNQAGINDDSSGIDSNQISSEFGYGVELGDDIGTLNPFVGLEFSNNEISQRQIGGRVLTDSNIEFELVGIHDSKVGLNEDYSLKFNGKIAW